MTFHDEVIIEKLSGTAPENLQQVIARLEDAKTYINGVYPDSKRAEYFTEIINIMKTTAEYGEIDFGDILDYIEKLDPSGYDDYQYYGDRLNTITSALTQLLFNWLADNDLIA